MGKITTFTAELPGNLTPWLASSLEKALPNNLMWHSRGPLGPGQIQYLIGQHGSGVDFIASITTSHRSSDSNIYEVEFEQVAPPYKSENPAENIPDFSPPQIKHFLGESF